MSFMLLNTTDTATQSYYDTSQLQAFFNDMSAMSQRRLAGRIFLWYFLKGCKVGQYTNNSSKKTSCTDSLLGEEAEASLSIGNTLWRV